MTDNVYSFPGLSDALLSYCEASSEPMVRSAPQWFTGFLKAERSLAATHDWRFTNVEAFKRQVAALRSPADVNRALWADHVRTIEAYSTMTMWRGAELLRPAIRSLNLGELTSPAVLARSLLELATAYLVSANRIDGVLRQLDFSGGKVWASSEFEEMLVRMIWGTRLGDPEPHLKQTNILTLIQKLAKDPKASDVLPHYEVLCEIAHPNVVGYSRFWSQTIANHADGSELRRLAREANGEHFLQIQGVVIWSLAWSSGVLRNGHALISNAVDDLTRKLKPA